jgi:alpha-tubulin suppressor-like RCC1 family protein
MELDLSSKSIDNKEIKTFVCGFRQSFFVTETKELFGCGESKKYELGVKSLKPLVLKQISTKNEEIIKLGTSKRAIFALSSAGNLLAMGTNDYGMFEHLNHKTSEDKCP